MLNYSIIDGRINASWVNEEDEDNTDDYMFWDDYYEGVMDSNDMEYQQDIYDQDMEDLDDSNNR